MSKLLVPVMKLLLNLFVYPALNHTQNPKCLLNCTPELLVHLEADLLDDEEGAGEVLLGAVLDQVRHQVVHRQVQDHLDRPVRPRVPGTLSAIWRLRRRRRRLRVRRCGPLPLVRRLAPLLQAGVLRGHGRELLVLPEEVLLEVEEAADEGAVEEGRPLADVQPHAALVRLQRVGREVWWGTIDI